MTTKIEFSLPFTHEEVEELVSMLHRLMAEESYVEAEIRIGKKCRIFTNYETNYGKPLYVIDGEGTLIRTHASNFNAGHLYKDIETCLER